MLERSEQRYKLDFLADIRGNIVVSQPGGWKVPHGMLGRKFVQKRNVPVKSEPADQFLPVKVDACGVLPGR